MSWILDDLATTKRFNGPKVEPSRAGDLTKATAIVPTNQPVYAEQPTPSRADQPAATDGVSKQQPATDWEKLIKENGYVGAFEKMYPKTDYTEDIRRQERKRQMDLIAQMAQVGMQAAAAGMGARRFTPITSNQQAIDERIDKLREAQKLADQRYGASMLQTAMQEFKEKQQREQQQAAQERENERWNRTFNFNVQKHNEELEYKREKAEEARTYKMKTYELNKKRLDLQAHRLAGSQQGKNKVVTSAYGSNGEIYTRNSDLSDFEAKQIAQAVFDEQELAMFATYEVDYKGQPKPGTQKIDWKRAASYAIVEGMLSGEELEKRGFKMANQKLSEGNKGADTMPGVEDNTIPGLKK